MDEDAEFVVLELFTVAQVLLRRHILVLCGSRNEKAASSSNDTKIFFITESVSK